MNINKYQIFQFWDKWITKDYYYLIAMTIYHIQILVFVTILGLEIKTHTFLPMILPSHAGDLLFLNFHFSLANPLAVMLTIFILIVDFAFLFIMKKEIKNYEFKSGKELPFKLTNKKIFIIEVIVLYLSTGNPFMRAILYFLSFNTIQIYVIYRIIFKYISPLKPLFIIGAYISIIKLFLFPIWDFYMFIR